MSLFRLSNLFFLILLIPFNGIAQYQRTCNLISGNPELEYEQKCNLIFKNPEVESVNWKEGGTVITSFSRQGIDSVVFFKDGQTGSFLAKDERIISPCILVKDQQGRIRSVDSLRMISPEAKYSTYYGYRYLSVVKWEYGMNGIPLKMFLKDKKGVDSLIREWNESGILQSESWKGTYPQTFLYYPDGILKSVEKDTLIKHWRPKRIRSYSESGTIQTESWFWNGKPCETWSIYDSKGKLSKTIKHPSLEDYKPLEHSIAKEANYSIVSQDAEFAGGQTELFRYLESKLKSELCKRRFSENTYVLRFEILEDGTCAYTSLQGPDVFEVESLFKEAIRISPRWAPAKKEGVPCKETFSLQVKVR